MKTIFWNVDTQYDFMRKDGALYVPGAEAIEGNLEKLTRLARKNRLTVVNTADWHDENTKEISATPDYVNTFPAHCMKNTNGSKYIPATQTNKTYLINWDSGVFDFERVIKSREIVIRKDAFDVFEGNWKTESILEALNPGRVIVYGVATNYCVDYAVRGLAKRGFDVYAVVDAMKEIPLPGEPEKTLNHWRDIGIKLATTQDIINMYEKR